MFTKALVGVGIGSALAGMTYAATYLLGFGCACS